MTQQKSTKLSGTANAVLGLLSFGSELSGYDLKKWADHSLSLFFWSPASSQIYAELRRLEEPGYVTSRQVPQDELRNKRVYRITDAGREQLLRWLEVEAIGPPVLKHPVLMRVWLGHLVGSARLREVIEEHRDRTAARLEDLHRDLDIVSTRENWAYPELIIRWSERYYEAERDNAEQLLQELDAVERRRVPEAAPT
ncbi:MAG TPA: PadR family transcriptional regulator [Acidimicrobiales bacterium]